MFASYEGLEFQKDSPSVRDFAWESSAFALSSTPNLVTKEYLNQRGTQIGVSGRPKMGDRGPGEEGRSGGRVNRA